MSSNLILTLNTLIKRLTRNCGLCSVKSAFKSACRIGFPPSAGAGSEPLTCGLCGSWKAEKPQTASESTALLRDVSPSTSEYPGRTRASGESCRVLELTSFHFPRGRSAKFSLPVFPNLAEAEPPGFPGERY